MIKDFFTRYSAAYIDTLLYMLQNTEYRLKEYFAWYHRTRDFKHVMKRRGLDRTRKIRLLQLALWGMWVVVLTGVAVCIIIGATTQSTIIPLYGLLLLAGLPFLLAYGIAFPLFLGRIFIQIPKERAMISAAKGILEKHSAVKIAVVGSFGKTTVKEMLGTVLGESMNVATTPGNMNTAIGISRFAKKLKGDEDVLVIEFGEERVGDVLQLSHLTQPTMAVMTGINEAHLSSFKTLKRTVDTIFEVVSFLGPKAKVYKNRESELVLKRASKHDPYLYDRNGVNGWKVTKLTTSLEEGTQFIVKKDKKTIKVHTSLIGLHTVGPTVAVIAIADELGLSVRKIEAGLKKVAPFEHRMQPRALHGAWLIDDTYNGNSNGIAAGLALLKTAKATRRIYVTPGLVEQGDKNKEVHESIGKQIAASADVAVLMENSVTDYIVAGLKAGKFKGETIIIDDPLAFYSNLDQFIAKGDVVLMQNDWTDNYR